MNIKLLFELPNEILVYYVLGNLTIIEAWCLFRAYPPLLLYKIGIELVRKLQLRRLHQLYRILPPTNNREASTFLAGKKLWRYIHSPFWIEHVDLTNFTFKRLEPNDFIQNKTFLKQLWSTDNYRISFFDHQVFLRNIQEELTIYHVLIDTTSGRLLFKGNTNCFLQNVKKHQTIRIDLTAYINLWGLFTWLKIIQTYTMIYGYTLSFELIDGKIENNIPTQIQVAEKHIEILPKRKRLSTVPSRMVLRNGKFVPRFKKPTQHQQLV